MQMIRLYTGDDSPIKLPSGWSDRPAVVESAPGPVSERQVFNSGLVGHIEENKKALSPLYPNDSAASAVQNILSHSTTSARGIASDERKGPGLPRVISAPIYR